jgi:hypothetical protein
MDGFKKEVERRQEERLKELTPVKSGLVEKSVVKSEAEKTNWLSSAQLWVDNPSSSNTTSTSHDKSSQEVRTVNLIFTKEKKFFFIFFFFAL